MPVDFDAALSLILSDERDLTKDLVVDLDRLSKNLSEHPKIFSFWSALLIETQSAHDLLKEDHELLKAQLSNKYREIAFQRTVKITASEIEQKVVMDSQYKGSLSELRQAKQNHEFAKMGVKCLEQKLQSMIAIAANQRASMRGLEPYIKEEPPAYDVRKPLPRRS